MTQPEIRTPVPLRTLHNVELAAVGTWKASTGETTFTAQDFTDAVAALECPGVRNPVLKLGHSEDDASSGVRWDGEPAVGWIANMRFDGQKMLGDYTGVPSWLADADENGLSVMAAAYPDRSIEIYRPFECQIGHLHPSVITAVALLGVAPPGIGVLKSMQDVYALFTQQGAEPKSVVAAAGAHVRPPYSYDPARGVLYTTATLVAAAEQREPTDTERASGVDFTQAQEQWDSALNDVLEQWPDISQDQREQLSAQIETAVDDNPDHLGSMTVDSAAAAAVLLAAMVALAKLSAAAQVKAAAKQGVTIALPEITDDDVQDIAEAVTAAMAAGTASAAGRAAAQALGTGDGKHVSSETLAYLAGLTDTFPRDQLGGALSAAQHAGRIAVLDGWDGDVDLFASELNDSNVCVNCREIDGKKFADRAAAEAAYGAGKYVDCLGGARCRGQLIAVFGSDAVRASALHTTIRTHLGGTMPTVVKASVSVEDISRKYYESAGYSMYITELQVDPLQLIAADDATGKYFKIPVELSGDTFVFGEPQEVALTYQDVKTAAKAPVQFGDRAASLLAAGKNPDGSDRTTIAPEVSPAGAAIRKAVQKAGATVLETEVAEPEAEETPDAEPATGPTTTHKEASVDAAKMREALGLGPDATTEEIAAAFAAQVTPPAAPPEQPEPLAVLTAKLPAGEKPILVDPENYKQLITMAAKGEKAYAEVTKARGTAFLEQAAKDGRFPIARLSAYQEMWDRNAEDTEAYVNLMPKNTVPVVKAGILGAEISQNETDMVFNAMFPEGIR